MYATAMQTLENTTLRVERLALVDALASFPNRLEARRVVRTQQDLEWQQDARANAFEQSARQADALRESLGGQRLGDYLACHKCLTYFYEYEQPRKRTKKRPAQRRTPRIF